MGNENENNLKPFWLIIAEDIVSFPSLYPTEPHQTEQEPQHSIVWLKLKLSYDVLLPSMQDTFCFENKAQPYII